MIILRVTKKQSFTLYLEDTFFACHAAEKTSDREVSPNRANLGTYYFFSVAKLFI